MQESAYAHSTERGLVLLLPTGYYLVGGTLAVAASFILLALIAPSTISRFLDSGKRLFAFTAPKPFWFSLFSTCFLFVLVYAGLFGSRDPLSNPLPIFIWSVWWVGFFLLQCLVGDLWRWLNPWSGFAQLLRRFAGLRNVPFTLPKAVAYWLAVIQFFAVAWFELVYIAPEDPKYLALVVSLFWVVNLGGVLVFGSKDWFERCEPFSVFFRLLGNMSPLYREETGDGVLRITTCFPGRSYLHLSPLPLSGVLFVLLTLSTVSFDGLLRTFFWLGHIGINPLEFPGRSAVITSNSIGLLLVFASLGTIFFLVVWLGNLITASRARFTEFAGRLIYSLIPVSMVFHFAHYLTLLLINSQYALVAFNDPFALHWNLFGLQGFHVTASFLNHLDSVRVIWITQTVAITLGHIIGIVIAHGIALKLFSDTGSAIRSQLFLAMLMIAYTLFGLWLLSTAAIG